METQIFPNALVIAAKTFAKKPAIVGEVLVALVTDGSEAKLTDVQRYIIAECREEIEERAAQREAARERKRRQRARGART